MRNFITDTLTGSSNTNAKVIALNDGALGHNRLVVKEIVDMALPVGILQMAWKGQPLTESEREFEEQKRLFENIPPLLLEQYRGYFVASRNGEVVDSDADMDCLVDRFFATQGDVPVFITRIGSPIREFVDTPFVD